MQIYASVRRVHIVRTTDNLYRGIIFIFRNTDDNRITDIIIVGYILVNNIVAVCEIIVSRWIINGERKKNGRYV